MEHRVSIVISLIRCRLSHIGTIEAKKVNPNLNRHRGVPGFFQGFSRVRSNLTGRVKSGRVT